MSCAWRRGSPRPGADMVALADTVGYGHPAQIRSVVRAVRAAIGDKLTGLHLHDTMGLGLANALAGLEEGIRDFDAALAGLGGCPFAPGASGNIVTEDLVFMLESMGFDTGIDLGRLIAARALLHEGLPGEPMHGQVPQRRHPQDVPPRRMSAAGTALRWTASRSSSSRTWSWARPAGSCSPISAPT